MHSTSKVISNEDLINSSKEKLDPFIFDFISGGSGEEWGVSNNVSSFQQYQIVPRVLQKSGDIDTSSVLLDQYLNSPIIIAPCAFHKLVCNEGELATARAAAKADTIFTLSTMSSYSIEDVAEASNSDKWFQLYVFKNKQVTLELIKKAEDFGYKALVITVDVPAMGMRLRDIKNNFSLPNDIEAANFKKVGLSFLSDKIDGSKIKEHTDHQFDSNMSWDSIDWISANTKLPIILKGILSPEDAEEALKHNIKGIIVSNHGGRQIDSIISAIDALPEIAKIINKKIPLILDSGVRCGEDIFKAIALGADAVMIGRPVLWALSVGGEDAVVALFSRLINEFTLTMRLAGCNNLQVIKDRGLNLLSGSKISTIKFFELIRKLENSPVTEEAIKTISSMRFF